jgi:hypothetical protein
MPYITEARQKEIGAGSEPENCGELNYVLTMIVLGYHKRKGARYQTINDVIGALEGAKAEFQRRIVAPYEDAKILENGDVYSWEP